VTGTREVNEDAFADKTVEVTETNEEAVVAKTARIAEEVVIHKDVQQDVETIRDTVRRDKVEVESVPVTKKTADARR
jgi:stress response protein YsnF